MTHDETFEAFRQAKREQEAATVKVTWRVATDGMSRRWWSGLGPEGRLVFVEREYHGPGYVYGHRVGRANVIHGRDVPTLAEAKRRAEGLLR